MAKEPPESRDSGAASEPSPMSRFRTLTEKLAAVDPAKVRDAEQRERKGRAKISPRGPSLS